uniref:Uncharacterized protein n=1 Tax=Moniliophthora roreri TaxID=221103 RepID=A0A0W0F9I4_MONRR
MVGLAWFTVTATSRIILNVSLGSSEMIAFKTTSQIENGCFIDFNQKLPKE